MLIDLLIVLTYFAVVLWVALSGRKGLEISSEEYFLSSRSLRWPSIALSTIATNISGYQFLGMMGSAYLYGLAQANLEINAIQGIWMAAFIFVPLYLKDKVITVTQFIKKRLGETVGLFYSLANLFLFATIGLGAALFWGAYAADMVFGDYLLFISDDPFTRITVLVIALGIFSAIYTYYGGLSAVVRTDVIQFFILITGGILILLASIYHLGGWSELYRKTPDLMHLHLPADHPKLPWIGMFGLFLLNINYWCANQSVVQRSLAARSLEDAQLGLMVGGVLKIFMAVIIVVPGIALAGILGSENGLADPDQAFPYLVKHMLSPGLRGIILCALFASLMSSVDSVFNSLATLWSVDIYKEYINKEASDRDLVWAGRTTILVTLFTGVAMGCLLLWVKLENPEDAFTHTLNELRYYINSGIVVIICASAFLIKPKQLLALLAFVSTVPINLMIKWQFPDMNYFVRSLCVISIAFIVIALPTIIRTGWQPTENYLKYASDRMKWIGLGLIAALIALHIIFH